MKENLQRVGFLAIIPPLLREYGLSPDFVLADAGFGPHVLDDPEAMISYASMGVLVATCATQMDCPHFGLILGQRAGARSLGEIGKLMANAPTLGAAMRDLAVHQHRHARGSVVYLVDQDEYVFFGYAIYQPDMIGTAQINDGAAAIAYEIIRNAVGRLNKDDLTVHLCRPEPADVGPYRQYFGCQIQFGSEFTGIAMPRPWMDRPIKGANATERTVLEARVETYFETGPYDVVARAYRWLTIGILTGEIGRDTFAAETAMSRRTLNRRLSEAGVSFQVILDDCRYQLAKQLLANTNLGISQISLILRYSDHSEFTRAFTRWSGLPPVEWKRRGPAVAMMRAAQ